MGYLTKTAVTDTVDLSYGYTATIRALRKADNDALQAILLGSAKTRGTTQLTGGQSTTTINQEMDNAAYTTATIKRGVVSWTLDDDAGAPLPITDATIAQLTAEDSDTLFTAIGKLNESSSKRGATPDLPVPV